MFNAITIIVGMAAANDKQLIMVNSAGTPINLAIGGPKKVTGRVYYK